MACGIHQLPFALKTHDQGSVVLGRCSSLSMGVFRMKKLMLMCVLLSGCAGQVDPDVRAALLNAWANGNSPFKVYTPPPVRFTDMPTMTRHPVTCMNMSYGFECY
jgi:hypothetical protein